jgi:phenylacetate-coenzyme A ligase PaaK-like adenylate-forming protein
MSHLSTNIGHRYLLRPLKKNESRRRLLFDLLAKANKSVPFYKSRYNEFLTQAESLNDSNFFSAYASTPITTKADLKTDHTAFMSDRFEHTVEFALTSNTPHAPMSAMDCMNHLFLKRNFRIPLSTGGTSGTPAFRWLDYHDGNIMAQSFFESFVLNGWSRGEPFVLYYPLQSYFTELYASYTPWLHRLFGLNVVPFSNITKESVEILLQTLKSKRAKLLVIFPCVLQRVAEIMAEHEMPPYQGLNSINVSGEYFFDCSRDFISQMFPGARIEMTYGAVEIGEIAHQNGQSSCDYKVFDQFAYVEEGPENSILVTTLRQSSFPLIRYKMEDKAQIVTKPNGQQYLMKLEGKNSDFLLRSDGQLCYASYFNDFINRINPACKNAIIHFKLSHTEKTAKLAFVLKMEHRNTNTHTLIEREAMHMMRLNFPQFTNVNVTFPDHFDHDYTRKFKIIADENSAAEVVGGYYKQAAG